MLDRPHPIELIRHVEHVIDRVKEGEIPLADVNHLCTLAIPLCGESFISARWCGDQDAVGIMVKHAPATNPPITNLRFIDPLYFAAALLMCLPGGRISVEAVRPGRDGKLYYYLRYEHPSCKSKDQRIYLARIIINASNDQSVRFIGDHHSLRLRDLALMAPDPRMKEPKLGRSAAIALARSLYEANTPAGLSAFSPEDFEALLVRLLEVADKYHGNSASGLTHASHAKHRPGISEAES